MFQQAERYRRDSTDAFFGEPACEESQPLFVLGWLPGHNVLNRETLRNRQMNYRLLLCLFLAFLLGTKISITPPQKLGASPSDPINEVIIY